MANVGALDDFVESVHKCKELMIKYPSLNKNHDTAMYAMSDSIPDKNFLSDFICIHQACLLDSLKIPEEEKEAKTKTKKEKSKKEKSVK
jgi:hypothetical protein